MPPSRPRPLTGSIACLLAVAGFLLGILPASPVAASALILIHPYHDVAGGPAFAGDALAWAVAAPDGTYDLTVSGGGGERLTRIPASGPRKAFPEGVALSASATRFALSQAGEVCVEGCKYDPAEIAHASEVTGALPSGLLEALTGCVLNPRWECAPPEVEVAGDAVAYRDPHGQGLTVRDFSTGAQTRLSADTTFNLAGPYVAADSATSVYTGRDPVQATITVYDWRTGARVYSVQALSYGSGASTEFGLQADGKVAFMDEPTGAPNQGELAWASPDAPFPHPLGLRAEFTGIRIAGDRIAAGSFAFAGDGTVYDVVDLAGHSVAAEQRTTEGPSSFDFDGQRLAWMTQPCEVTAVVVWDLRGNAPALPGGSCSLPRVRSLVVDFARRRISYVLSCPRAPALGCVGGFDVGDFQSGYATKPYWLDPGRRSPYALRIRPRLACRLSRAAHGTLAFSVGGITARRPTPFGRRRLRFRAIGRPHGCLRA